MMNNENRGSSIDSWVLVLGLVGLFAGLGGFMVLRPSENLSSPIGVLITGVGGALLGLLLGALCRLFKVSESRQVQALVAASVVLALGILYFCLPV